MTIRYDVVKSDGSHYRWKATQISFWVGGATIEEKKESILEVEEWCVDHLDENLTWYANTIEMVVYFADEQSALAFKMRWT